MDDHRPVQTVYLSGQHYFGQLQMLQYDEEENPHLRLIVVHDQQVFVEFQLQLELFADFDWSVSQLVQFFVLRS